MYSLHKQTRVLYGGPLEKDWHVVIENALNELYNMPEKVSKAPDDVNYGQTEAYNIRSDKMLHEIGGKLLECD